MHGHTIFRNYCHYYGCYYYRRTTVVTAVVTENRMPTHAIFFLMSETRCRAMQKKIVCILPIGLVSDLPGRYTGCTLSPSAFGESFPRQDWASATLYTLAESSALSFGVRHETL